MIAKGVVGKCPNCKKGDLYNDGRTTRCSECGMLARTLDSFEVKP